MAAPLADDQRIAIGFGTHDPAGTDGAAGSGDVLDQNGLTERCLHAFGERARDNVGRSARWERCDNGDRPRRIACAEAMRETASETSAWSFRRANSRRRRRSMP